MSRVARPQGRVLLAAALSSFALVTAGCIDPVPNLRTAPTLTLFTPGTCPLILQVSLTNNDPAPLNASVQGFWLGDSAGARRPANLTATHAFPTDAFPDAALLLRGATAEGVVAFEEGPAQPPYSLTYDFDAAYVSVALNGTDPGADPCANSTLPAPQLGLAAQPWSGNLLLIPIHVVRNAPFLTIKELSVAVTSSNGSTCYEGPREGNSTVCGSLLKVHYTDAYRPGEVPGRVTAGDTFWLNVSAPVVANLHGGAFTVFVAGRAIGRDTIP